MIDNEALQTLIGLASMDATRIGSTDATLAIVPDNASVVELDRFNDQPRAMKETVSFVHIGEFCKYVNDSKIAATAAFIQPDGSGAKAIIDFGFHDNPEWGRHKATLSIPETPEWEAVKFICSNGAVSQRQLVEFMEDWPDIITPINSSGEDFGLGQATSAVRAVTIKLLSEAEHVEHDFEVSRSRLDEISANSKGQDLPYTLRITAALREELEPTQIELRITFAVVDEKPAFRLRVVGLANHEKAAAKEVEAKIRELLGDTRTFVGTV